jgi:dTDP-4-dehydrorhamnose 3,5-epimerase
MKIYKINPNNYKTSSGLINGILVKKLIRRCDKRGFFEELIRVSDPFFKEGFAQLSHSFMHKGVIKAWHIHKTQIDWWFVASGHLHVALYDNRKNSITYGKINTIELGEKYSNVILKIPSGVAHGCKVITRSSELFYITSKTYDTKEEGRISENDSEIGYDWLKTF